MPNFLEPKEIKRLIGILSSAGGLELELEDQGMRLRIRMPEPQSRTEYVGIPSMPSAPYPGYAQQAPPPAVNPPSEAAEDENALPAGGVYVNSPMVGTFYRASSPESDAFCNVGDRVESDSTVCIIEAMKVMNEIKAEQSGEVLRILVENGEPVEFGQPLFILKVS